jgi:putative transposase
MSINLPRRRNSLRYPGYDYAQPGSVFVTICTHERQPLFGAVVNGLMHLNDPGKMVDQTIQALPGRFPDGDVDAWVVMPDHVHLIVYCAVNPETERPDTLGTMIRWFKATTVEAWRTGARNSGWPRYERHLWQPDYHDRIIRNDRQLQIDKEYILGNPDRWWEKNRDAPSIS